VIAFRHSVTLLLELFEYDLEDQGYPYLLDGKGFSPLDDIVMRLA